MEKMLILMKMFFLGFSLLGTSAVCFSQEFGTLNSEWVYNYNGYWSQGVTIVKFEKDTLILGIPTQVYSKKALRRRSHSMDTFSSKPYPIYIRSSDGIVLMSEFGEVFDTLINYKAEIGRSWIMHRRLLDHSIIASIKLTVLDTFRSNFSGVNLFSQAVRYTWPQFTDYVDTVYQFMGSRFHYIIPFDEYDVDVDGGEGGELRCFRNDKIGLVSFSPLKFGSNYAFDCNNLLGSSNPLSDRKKISLSINNQNSIVRILNYTGNTTHLQFMDVIGRSVWSNTLSSEVIEVNISEIPSGVYLVLAGQLYIGKFIR